MKITVLGSGTSQGIPVIGCDCPVCQSVDPKDKRLRVSVHLTLSDGHHVLIDTSPDLRQQLLVNKIIDIDSILITHEHNDHIIGLDDIRPINFMQRKDMPLYSMSRVNDVIKSKFDYALGDKKYPGAPLIDLQVIDGPFELGGNQVIPIKIMHGRLPILGFRIGKVAYLTDIKTIEAEEIEKLRGIDVLIISALRKEEHHSHMNLQQALALIEDINPKESYLTHISHRFGTHKQISSWLPANVHVAFDGQSIEVQEL